MVNSEKYIAPECEEFHIRIEDGILTISGQGNESEQGGYWDDED